MRANNIENIKTKKIEILLEIQQLNVYGRGFSSIGFHDSCTFVRCYNLSCINGTCTNDGCTNGYCNDSGICMNGYPID